MSATEQPGTGTPTTSTGGPYFDELAVGDLVLDAPALTLTEGHAALHQSLLGDRLRIPLDHPLSRAVLGCDAPLVHPALVCDVAIGQSTLITRRVIGNLFYRGLVLRRAPTLGDTLHTTTEVVALRQNRPKPDRAATGLAVLRVLTVDQSNRAVLDYWRCAMLPLRDPDGATGHADDLDAFSAELDAATLSASVAGWNLEAFRAAVPGEHFAGVVPGTVWEVEGGDVVGSAPLLARLSLNVAMAHHDAEAGARGRRLVYGGHTIGVAASQATRALPNLVTIVGWHGCDHLGPVHEGDTLRSSVEVERAEALPDGGGLVHLRSRMRAERDGPSKPVLDWRFVALMA